MKTLLFIVAVAATITLTGCAPDKHITEVKALAFSYPSNDVQDPNMTVDQALDYRKVCDSVKWKVDETEQHQTFVEYNCDYKNVKDSSFVANNLEEAKAKNPNATGAVRVGDVYQWVYGADGKPELSYVTLRYQFADGSSKDVTQSDIVMGQFRLVGAGWMTTLMQQAVENTAIDYDHLYSQLYGKRIPPLPLPLIKPASPITKSTYANTVAALYPGKSPTEAAALAYRWIGSPVKVQGVNALGYPTQAGTCKYKGETVDRQNRPQTAGAMECVVTLNNGTIDVYDEAQFVPHLLLVDPKDVQTGLRVLMGLTSVRLHEDFVQLSPMKLLCADYLCFDRDGHLVGRAPDSVFAKETVIVLPPKVTPDAYGNDLARYYPDRSPQEAMKAAMDELSPIETSGMNTEGYPVYEVKCVSDNDCFHTKNGELLPQSFGSPSRTAGYMFPVNPKDIGKNGIQCDTYFCKDGQGNIIGSNPDLHPSPSVTSTNTATPPPAPALQVAQAVQPTSAASVTPQVGNSAAPLSGAQQSHDQATTTTTVHSGDVGPDGWPKMTPCIEKLQKKFTIDQEKQNADTSTSMEQMQEWADVCKSLGQ
jgi:hypothetical protein